MNPEWELSELVDDDLRQLLLIRHFEFSVLDLFSRGLLAGTTHTCLGQEYVPVAVSGLVQEGDFVFSNHRGHGHYLARYGDADGLLAEIMGREGAICNGVGGSQHLFRDAFMSTGIQGQSLPVAAGMALSLKNKAAGAVVIVYMGDGTWGEGAVYEALNLSQLWRLPVLFVVENNGIAQSTPTHRQLAGDIAGRVAGFGIVHQRVDTADVNHIRAAVSTFVQRVRDESLPGVIEFGTTRLGPHSKGDDSRTASELAGLREHDWREHYARRYPAQFQRVDDEQRRFMAEVVAKVSARPLVKGTSR